MEVRIRVTKIAGRGKPGDWNWGWVPRSESEIEKELQILRRHLGQIVLLSGGGGPGVNLAVLEDAWIERMGNGEKALRVKLTHLTPPLGGRDTFTPYVGSWQISALGGGE